MPTTSSMPLNNTQKPDLYGTVTISSTGLPSSSSIRGKLFFLLLLPPLTSFPGTIRYIFTDDTSQRIKNNHPCDGLLPPSEEPELDPCYQVQVDLVGPWQFNMSTLIKISVRAFSVVDLFTGIFEIAHIKNKKCPCYYYVSQQLVLSLSFSYVLHP